MYFEKNNICAKPIKVLVAPLDWGLGHATRCIPIIYELLSQNIEVWVAVEGSVKTLLQKELPQVTFLSLEGYKVRYSKFGFWFFPKLLLQLPRIFFVIRKEHKWLKAAITTHGFNAVISDNRLGLWHSSIPCYYITHQLQIITGNLFTNWIAQKTHYFFINKFKVCWVPDSAIENVLAGNLSHPKKLPKTPVVYVGPLSRLKKQKTEKKYTVLILLSGPEPQRSIFENILLPQLENFSEKIILIRGLADTNSTLATTNKNLVIHNHLPAVDLSTTIQQSELIISRSGYTTIMDLVALQKKAVVVPTPGQTEQEYLATQLSKEKIFLTLPQKGFSLAEAISVAKKFSFKTADVNTNQHQKVIKQFIDELKNQ